VAVVSRERRCARAEVSGLERPYQVVVRWNADPLDIDWGACECDCPDRARGRSCKHIIALAYRLADEEGRAGGKAEGTLLRLAIDFGTDPDGKVLSLSAFALVTAYPGARKKAIPMMHAAIGRAAESLGTFLSLEDYWPALAALRARPSILVEAQSLSRFLSEAGAALKGLGVELSLSKDLKKLLRPRLFVDLKRKMEKPLETRLGLEALLSFDRRLAMGSLSLDEEAFEALALADKDFVRYRNLYAKVAPEEAAGLLHLGIGEQRLPNSLDLMRAWLSDEAGFTADAGQLVASLLRERMAPLPSGLTARLRPYQERGYRWAYSNLSSGFGCLIADDMGLGKTIQAIALMLRLREEGRDEGGFLVVAPAALLVNWMREIGRFAPCLAARPYHGPGRSLGADRGVVVTSYDTALRDAETLSRRSFALIVADEAQVLKNASTAKARAFRALKSRYRLALSGTPIENKLEDLRAIVDLVLPGYLGTKAAFRKAFRVPIELERDAGAAERLRRITGPFILRRLKTDPTIAQDLPGKVVIDERAVLAPAQASLYEGLVRDTMECELPSMPLERLALVLRLLTSLKQVCDHPRLYDKESPPRPELSGKAVLLLELLPAMLEGGEKVLLFSQFVECLDLLATILEAKLGEPCVLYTGRMGQEERSRAVDSFQSASGPRIMLASLRAGGLGLNLNAASRVVHYDLWYNPAVEAQATDRAHRIGQARTVFVHRFVVAGTFEEKIDQMLKSKGELAGLALSEGESWLSRLGDKELRAVFEPFP
jgi:superfamily II DNA or RNA helicase